VSLIHEAVPLGESFSTEHDHLLPEMSEEKAGLSLNILPPAAGGECTGLQIARLIFSLRISGYFLFPSTKRVDVKSSSSLL
jgi:hypothetical protein